MRSRRRGSAAWNATMITACLILAAAARQAAGQCSRNPKDWIAPGRFTIQQDLDQTRVARPAYAQYTKAAGDTASYSIALGVRYNVACGGLVEFGPYAELARNSLTSNPQNVLRGGLSYDVSLYDIGPGASTGPALHRWTPVFTGRLGAKRDAVAGSRAFDASVFVTPVVAGVGGRPSGWYRPNVITRFPVADVTYTAAPGLELQSDYATRETSGKTTVARGVGTAAVELYPFAAQLHSGLAARASYAWRYDVARRNVEGTRSHAWFESALSYYFIGAPGDQRLAGVELAYQRGSDPSEGFQTQKVMQLRVVLRNH